MYIKVRVTADAKKEELHKVSENFFEISVREKAERNMANKRVVAIISAHFGPVSGKVRIVSGHHSPSKIVSVE